MTKDWNLTTESKSENHDPDKIMALFGNHQGGRCKLRSSFQSENKRLCFSSKFPVLNLKLQRLEQEKRQISLQVISNILKDLLRITIAFIKQVVKRN